MSESFSPHNEPIPESVIQDKHKAEEMAHSEDPYRVLIANAEQAVAKGATSMSTVLEELKNNMHNTAHQTGESYDERRQFIEQQKYEITQKILHALQKSSNLSYDEAMLIHCGEYPRGYWMDEYFFPAKSGMSLEEREAAHKKNTTLRELHPEEANEIRNTAYSLLGIVPPETEGSIPSSSDSRTVSGTGIELREITEPSGFYKLAAAERPQLSSAFNLMKFREYTLMIDFADNSKSTAKWFGSRPTGRIIN